MADFFISSIAYNEKGEHIEWLLVREDLEKNAGPEVPVHRQFVADLIRLKLATFQTLPRSPEGKISRGAMVHLYDEKFLSTSANKTERDNLENLPIFEFPPK
ncbi:hypothetical protein [Pseudomonas fragi]|uniref:hypothetical protein n=1 Tax=Pseudomonas fragi TaxID=296 RepID=UPI002D79234E|nr:hypothetical protein [Pseudomonas fragi]WRT59317.1 hypothetical protein VK847_15135 [Pseudomonas fragi]